jgi:hypothetical protein
MSPYTREINIGLVLTSVELIILVQSMEQSREKHVRTIRTKVGYISKNNCYRQELEMYFFFIQNRDGLFPKIP